MAAANRRTMTKAELVEEVARAAELNKRDAEVIVETVFESIIGALHKGEKVELRGFGSFRTRERGPRRGRNPKTGEPVDVPAKRVPYFKPGKELKEYFTEGPEGSAGAGETRPESETAGASAEAAGSSSPDYTRDSSAAGDAPAAGDVTGEGGAAEGGAVEPGGAAEGSAAEGSSAESSDNEGRTGGSNY